MNAREELLKKLSAYSFAEKEWNLYLDTHPNDRDGLMMHRRMADKAKELSKEFEEKFGPLTTMNVTNTECFDWIEEPWPWDSV